MAAHRVVGAADEQLPVLCAVECVHVRAADAQRHAEVQDEVSDNRLSDCFADENDADGRFLLHLLVIFARDDAEQPLACFAAGASMIIWLGDRINEKGIGNGISIIIFAGIVACLTPVIAHTIEHARQVDLQFLVLLVVAVFVFAVTFFVVFVERGQRRIVVNYAKRQQGRRVYAAQSTQLPLKVNMAGVIPAIFASSIILFPATIASWFGGGTGWNWLTTISLYLQPGQPLYVLLYASAIIFFCFFYTALVFNPRETADNLKKSGAFVPGIRPGEQTAKYIDKVMTRLTLVGALYITFICLIPEFMRDAMKVPFYFGGTSLLIVVVVIMDFMAQVQTLMMSSQYESALKKANLKGYGR